MQEHPNPKGLRTEDLRLETDVILHRGNGSEQKMMIIGFPSFGNNRTILMGIYRENNPNRVWPEVFSLWNLGCEPDESGRWAVDYLTLAES